ncbi:MgtC/SapB family protein [Lapidilactobacillus luobeiensis]|uniref:MgtC/SapB family protein n=1 Tax=Lapidilactobacillus luobeiensis TaxID=2950371 RepID=UPI0021C49B5F|nr:MgtC/SapB family protein [Lapidilactobacillus luobeiensis]
MILKLSVTTVEILIRLLAAVLISGLIGYDREQKNHPAGIRTHILVCVGACVIAMIQQEIGFQALAFAKAQPQFAGVIRADEARLIAQVVSGIGFLGAGTIVVTHRAVTGLTTAASLWATAGLGLAVGMGYYRIAGLSALVVLAVLALLKKVIRVHPAFKRVEIQYTDKAATRALIQTYFAEKKIKIERVSFKAAWVDDEEIYTNVYTIELPHDLSYAQLVDDLSAADQMRQVRLINV